MFVSDVDTNGFHAKILSRKSVQNAKAHIGINRERREKVRMYKRKNKTAIFKYSTCCK